MQPSGEPAALHDATGQRQAFGRQAGKPGDSLRALAGCLPEAACERRTRASSTALGAAFGASAERVLPGRSETQFARGAWLRTGSCPPVPGAHRGSRRGWVRGAADGDREVEMDVVAHDRRVAHGEAEGSAAGRAPRLSRRRAEDGELLAAPARRTSRFRPASAGGRGRSGRRRPQRGRGVVDLLEVIGVEQEQAARGGAVASVSVAI